MAQISAFSSAFTKFAADFASFKTDLVAFLAAQTPEDPAVQATIDGFTQQLGDLDTSVQGMDQSLKPAPPAPAPAA